MQPAADFEQLQKLYRDGNFAESFTLARQLFTDSKQDPAKVAEFLWVGTNSLNQLGRQNEADALLEDTVKAHAEKWQVLHAVANAYRAVEHRGFIIDNQFERMNQSRRGGGRGQFANSFERDRVRSLQLYQKAIKLIQQEPADAKFAPVFQDLSYFLIEGGHGRQSWRLQNLTDLETLPDYDDGNYYPASPQGAPVDEEGNPIFYHVPASWEDAKSDGERMRWAMTQVVEYDASRLNQVRFRLAQLWQSQFGVQTLAQYGFFPRGSEDDVEPGTVLSLETLKETETIARLASGIKRFDLPDEFNHLKLYRQIIENKDGHAPQAYDQLAHVFENRTQFPQAAKVWREAIEAVGPGSNDYRKTKLNQIVANLGQFQGGQVQPAGQGASLQFLFRNGNSVELTAHRIDEEKLLKDLKDYLKSNPPRLDYQKYNLQQIGYRIVNQNEDKYVAEQVAQWTMPLEPRPNHVDRSVTIQAPLTKAGAYLLTAKMKDGNTSKIVVWVADTAIASKQLSDARLYYVADAVTGKPIPRANVEFFGFRQEQVRNRNQFQITTKNFAERTDADGQIKLTQDKLLQEYQWLVMARTDAGRMAYLGFQGVWYSRIHDPQYNAVKSYGITDRPVYRPGDKVKFKFWIRKAQYDRDDVSDFANRKFEVRLHDPQGNELLKQNYQTDEYAGLDGEWEIPSDATLGSYNLWTSNGNVAFRIEEYKKPEFEVTVDAPEKPVALGEKIEAKITAKYYFGSPVTQGTVKYKIERTTHQQRWYPIAPWDWFYGSGYWWYAYDYTWYPGFDRWVGCVRPAPFWIGWGHNPPELVAEQEVPLNEDGTISVEIDTAIAKAMHGREDHRYTITAEVRDQSRRTIVGTGEVLVAREPFKVFTWLDRGHYEVGQTIQANFRAQTLDRKPVTGKGEIKLFKITYDKDRQPQEAEVQSWEVQTDAQGAIRQPMQATAAGQYRVSLKMTDEAGHTQEGAYIFTIRGEGFDGAQYRFNQLELIPDKQEYAPGDKVQLQINTDRPGGTLLLFIRPTNGIYLPPQMLRLAGKSTTHEIAVVTKDMPNFFVEALTIYDGQVHQETKEIVVPPAQRVLDMKVEPSQETYKPGEKANLKITLIDETGEPFVGSTVVSVYDKAVEYISGGSNVGDIREFFWKWRRHHHPQVEHSLSKPSYNLVPKGETTLATIGQFGGILGNEMEGYADGMAYGMSGRGGGGMGGMGMPMAPMSRNRAFAADAAAPAADMEMAQAEGIALKGGVDKVFEKQAGEAQPEFIDPTVRTNFVDTALWVASLTTNEKGEAEVSLDMPESLTSWKIKAWGMGHGTKVGSAEADVVTRKNLLVRLQAPRFFVQKDEVVLSANVHNYLETAKDVKVVLHIPGGILESEHPLEQMVRIEAGGEKRVDWRVSVKSEGEATIRMSALSDEESDAMEMTFPAKVHGMLKTESWAGTVQPEDPSQTITFRVPEERRPDDTRLVVRYSPSLAASMVDALPYLIEYPYGCTEQTLNRFLPSVITQKVLIDMQLDLAKIQEERANLNAQELGDPAERAKQWQRFKRNPVFDQAELNKIVKDGVEKLAEMQLSDGGWGWFSGHGEHSAPHTTAVVVRGLMVARDNDVAIVPEVIERGLDWLARYQAQELQRLQNADGKINPWKLKADHLDAMVYAILVEADRDNPEMRNLIYRDRNNLSIYAQAMFALALHQVEDADKLAMVRRNIEQFLITDEENDTAYLDAPGSPWWYWYGDVIEGNAYYLKLMAAVDPENVTTRRLVKYLLNNRKHATYWKSTRDTALVIEAMADYLRATDEMAPDMTVELFIDGEKKGETVFTKENLFTANNTLELTGDQVTSGEHKLEIRRKGKGPVYFSTYLTNFTLEDPITKAGLEVKVERRYYRLDRVDATKAVAGDRGQSIDQKVEKFERTLLASGDEVTSGDLIEIELLMESKNDYEYIMFEDQKAAGMEPMEVRSGYGGNTLGAYMELRDDRVTFFLRTLPHGRHSVTYRMRAEIPGKFSALPAIAQGMYAPELVGNSDELKIIIADQE